MLTHWRCSCGTTGSYAWADITTKTDASLPDAKHHKTCGRTVVTSTSGGVLERVSAP